MSTASVTSDTLSTDAVDKKSAPLQVACEDAEPSRSRLRSGVMSNKPESITTSTSLDIGSAQ